MPSRSSGDLLALDGPSSFSLLTKQRFAAGVTPDFAFSKQNQGCLDFQMRRFGRNRFENLIGARPVPLVQDGPGLDGSGPMPEPHSTGHLLSVI